MADPLTRLALLERAVAGLIAGKGKPRRSEALQPTYLTTDSAGRTSADFTGHVHAQGLDLDAATAATPPDTDRVRWLRTADGAALANINTVQSAIGAQTTVQLAAQSDTASGGNPTSVKLTAQGDVGTQSAELAVLAGRAPGGNNKFTLSVGAQIAILLDDLGKSEWLQIGSTALSTVNGATVTWPGGSSLSTALNVKLTGATGAVNGIGTPVGVISGTLFIPTVAINSDGAGGVNITAQHPTGAAVAAASTVLIFFILFGN